MKPWHILILVLLTLAGGVAIVGCDTFDGWPPVASVEQAAQIEGVEPGDVLPADASNHPLDQSAGAIRDVGGSLAPVLDAPTGGMWSVGVAGVLGVLALARDLAARRERAKRRYVETAVREIDADESTPPAASLVRSLEALQGVELAKIGR